jgi:LCP family protein required for cell wall assembly
MKNYIRLFTVAFAIFLLLIWGGTTVLGNNAEVSSNTSAIEEIDEFEGMSQFNKLVKKESRINIVVLGTDGERSDTMMVVSFEPESKLVDIISIPRDTYHYVPGKNLSGQKKINAVYSFSGDIGGSEGVRKAAEEILGVPIKYYVKTDYKAVSAIVDVIGGVQINVRNNMYYDDPFAKPPLHINLKKGLQTLDGKKSLQYLRWRKNNDGTQDRGDLTRIARQQEFAIACAKKAMGLKLPLVIKTAFDYVDTNMNIGDMLNLGTSAIGMDYSQMQSHRIPGDVGMKDKLSYYFHDEAETKKLMESIYLRGSDIAETNESKNTTNKIAIESNVDDEVKVVEVVKEVKPVEPKIKESEKSSIKKEVAIVENLKNEDDDMIIEEIKINDIETVEIKSKVGTDGITIIELSD